MGYAIVEVPHPDPDAPLHPLLRAYHEFQAVTTFEQYGNDDFNAPLDVWIEYAADTSTFLDKRWLAVPAGVDPESVTGADVLASGFARLPQREMPHFAELHVMVRQDARSRGIGRAMSSTIEETLRGDGRTTVVTWQVTERIDDASPDAVVASTGNGSVDRRDPATVWLTKDGWELAQVEQYSIQHLPQPSEQPAWMERIDGLASDAGSVAGGDYEVLLFDGYLPTEHHEGMAAMRRRASVDVPTGSIEVDEQNWDAARIAEQEEKGTKGDARRLTVLARHRPSGTLVGFSSLQWNAQQPEVVHQRWTFVDRDHRGHRLGLLMKARALGKLLEVNPEARRIHTWNAAENVHMLAVNDALGYESPKVQAHWQKRLG